MDIKFDKSSLKTKIFWVYATPVILLLWVLVSFYLNIGVKRDYEKAQSKAEKVEDTRNEILRNMKKLGFKNTNTIAEPFNDLVSIKKCAKFSKISDVQIKRADASAPKDMKDGSVKHHETYKISHVKLLNAVKFIDYAEREFANVSCIDLKLTALPSKTKDAWDAIIVFEYLTGF